MHRISLPTLVFYALTASLLAQSNPALFAPVVTYNSGGLAAESVAIADVNGDGKPDILVANCAVGNTCTGKGVVGVLLGNGDGSFQPVITYDSGGFWAIDVAVADLNGDGRPDLVVANNCGSNTNCPEDGWVTVLLGNGDGTFQSAVGYSSGGIAANSVAVADVDGDGRLDLVVPNLNSDTVGVLLGNGDGTFQTAVTYSSGAHPFRVAIADVNGDGKSDVIVANQYQGGTKGNLGAVSVLLSNGDGTFQSAVTYSSGGNFSFAVAVADINGDGRPDLVVTNLCVVSDTFCTAHQNAPVGVLLGQDNGTFAPAVTYLSGGESEASVAIADIDGDGRLDLLVGNLIGTVGALLGNGDGTFQTARTYAAGGGSVAVADVNGDGKPDAVTANGAFFGLVGVLLNTASTDTTPPTITASATPKILFPPSGKMVPVTVSGTITDSGSGANPGTAEYIVRDEYHLIEPQGKIALSSTGAYSFTILLQASVQGQDLDGRQYVIRVTAKDNVGNRSAKWVSVKVPHGN